jgi:hypothetical protein
LDSGSGVVVVLLLLMMANTGEVVGDSGRSSENQL